MGLEALPGWAFFILGALGGSSGWMCVHPFDVLKVRLQISKDGNKGFLDLVKEIWTKEGFFGFYSGVSAALTRQCTYGTVRIGLYDFLKATLVADPANMPLPVKCLCSGGSGVIASCLCVPVEVALVRMQADGQAPPEEKRNYKHAFDAIYRVAKEEGILGMYTGIQPTAIRAIVVGIFQLTTYDVMKNFLKGDLELLDEGLILHSLCGLIAGFVYSSFSLPIDICKTRIQNQRKDPVTGKFTYNGVFHALSKIPSEEGAFALWKGFLPYFARCGGHTVFMYIFLEQYRSLFVYLFDEGILTQCVGAFVALCTIGTFLGIMLQSDDSQAQKKVA